MCRKKWWKNWNLPILGTGAQRIIQIEALVDTQILHQFLKSKLFKWWSFAFLFFSTYSICCTFIAVSSIECSYLWCVLCALICTVNLFLQVTTLHDDTHSHRSCRFTFIESQSRTSRSGYHLFSSLKSTKTKQSTSKTPRTTTKNRKLLWLENSEPTQYQ